MKINSIRNILNLHIADAETNNNSEFEKELKIILAEVNEQDKRECNEHYENRMKSEAFAKAEAEKLAKRAERNAQKLEADRKKLAELQASIEARTAESSKARTAKSNKELVSE